MLYQRRLWTPVDGFGVECDAEVNRSYVAAEPPPPASKITVLHLHGSVYLYPLEFETYAVPGDDTVWLRDPAKVPQGNFGAMVALTAWASCIHAI